MPINGTVQATGEFAPTSSGDTYAILDTKYLRGGLHHVDTLSDLNTITSDRREVGMITSVSGTSYYKLAPEPWSYTLSDWSIFLDGNDIYVTGATLSTGYTLTLSRNDNNNVTVNLAGLASDIYVVSGVYNETTGVVTFTNSTGGTFNVSGFTTGMTQYWTSGSTGLYSIKANNPTGLDATGAYAVAEGDGPIASGYASHAEGNSTLSEGVSSHAEGGYTNALGYSSHAEGYQSTAIGDYSHAEGRETTASGTSTHSEGYLTTAMGMYSHAEGYYNIASGIASHVEGGHDGLGASPTTASGSSAHAEGQGTVAGGPASHAEGAITTALGDYSHSEGLSTTSLGLAAHAEGDATIAIGNASHAEGQGTTSIGQYSHAEGWLTVANGDYSHAGGANSIASGNTSFAHGSGSTASGIGTIVLGNGITGTTDNTVFVNNLNINSNGLITGQDLNKSRINFGSLGNEYIEMTTDGGLWGEAAFYMSKFGGSGSTIQMYNLNSQFIDFIADPDSLVNSIRIINGYSGGIGYRPIIGIGVNNTIFNSDAQEIIIVDNTNEGFTINSDIGTSKKAIFIGTSGSSFNSGVTNSVIIGGIGIVASENNTAYVDYLNIKTLGSGTSITNLGIDSNGFVVQGANSIAPALSAVTAVGNTTTDDIEITDFTKGVILRSPDNTRWRITVDNSGSLITTIVV